ncbi:MAG: hypothetical protein WC151_04055, partial [Bacteroidales bacterium]
HPTRLQFLLPIYSSQGCISPSPSSIYALIFPDDSVYPFSAPIIASHNYACAYTLILFFLFLPLLPHRGMAFPSCYLCIATLLPDLQIATQQVFFFVVLS